jgi:hypothetical protein
MPLPDGQPRTTPCALFPGPAVGQFHHDVELANVARVLLEQVEQDPFERRRIGAIPPLAGLADVGEIMGADDNPGPFGLGVEVRDQAIHGLVGGDIPAVIPGIGPRLGDVTALEAPVEPAHLDVPEVLEQLDRCPAGRQPAAANLVRGQAAYLVHQPVTEEIEVPQENLGPR